MSGRSGLRAARVAACALAIGCLAALARTILSVPLHVPLNYNEGWNAYHVAEALGGRALYAHANPFLGNNYPPLSFYLVAAATRIVGDPIVAGRALSLAAFLAWTLTLVLAARAIGCRWIHAGVGALLFAASLWQFTEYVGIDDPEMMGHALQGAALVVLLAQRRAASAIAAAALLFTLGVLIKQTLVVLPLAAVAWLAYTDRARAARLALFGAGFSVLAAAGIAAVFGASALGALVEPREHLPLKAAWMALQFAGRMIVPIGALVWLWRAPVKTADHAGTAGGDEARDICVTYAAVAIVSGAILGGGAGVNWNVYFDAYWALGLSAAVALERATRVDDAGAGAFADRRATLAMALLVVPAIALWVGAKPAWLARDYWLAPRRMAAADAARDIQFLRSRGAPVLCEELALCWWAGVPADVDVFTTQQRQFKDPSFGDLLVRRIDAREFTAIQLDNAGGRELGPAFDAALARNYADVARGLDAASRLLVPRN